MNRRMLILLMVGGLLLMGADSFAQGEPRAIPSPPVVAETIVVEVNGISLGDGVFVDFDPSIAEVKTYRDVPDHLEKKRPGGVASSDLTLVRPLTADTTLVDWWRKIYNGKTTRRTVAVIYLDGSGSEITRWCFYATWPFEYGMTSFDRWVATEGAQDYLQAGDTVYERIKLATEKAIPGC